MIETGLFVLCLIVACNTQVPFSGSCPPIKAKQNFRPEKYLGKWYEQEKYFASYEVGGKCITAIYSAVSKTSIGVLNKQINSETDAEKSISGIATFVGKSNDARLEVAFNNIPGRGSYWVLDTDYKNYAVVYSCTNVSCYNTKNLWILTRERYPSEEVLEMAYHVIDKNGLNSRFLTITDQENCPDTY